MTGQKLEAERVSQLMHDINGALWVAISILDLTLANADTAGCKHESVKEALESCLEIVSMMHQLKDSVSKALGSPGHEDS